MNRCPITYEFCGTQKYSEKGLNKFSKYLKELHDFPYTAEKQVQLAIELAAKLSIQGMQPKLSVLMNVRKESFEIVNQGGTFIIKPPNPNFPELPQNEDLTMKLAATVGIEIPFHGMIYNIDNSLSYFIKRFDRMSKKQKVATEDFSQLLGYTRDTKYESSMEQVISVIEKHCTFPKIEKIKLLRLTLFNYLIGNEDMHLKNFSLIRRKEKTELSPAYDLVNSTIVFPSKEEIALPIRGKKNNLKKADLFDYFGNERLGIEKNKLKDEFLLFEKSIGLWMTMIENSFLSKQMQNSYKELIDTRWKKINE